MSVLRALLTVLIPIPVIALLIIRTSSVRKTSDPHEAPSIAVTVPVSSPRADSKATHPAPSNPIEVHAQETPRTHQSPTKMLAPRFHSMKPQREAIWKSPYYQKLIIAGFPEELVQETICWIAHWEVVLSQTQQREEEGLPTNWIEFHRTFQGQALGRLSLDQQRILKNEVPHLWGPDDLLPK